MPRWKELPEELDPQLREFAGQLRTLVDRKGLSVAALADATGYSKTSWERYLNGRLLPPLRAVVALAEATGAPSAHLTTLWELAERAWSRAEMRHDVTMEAISVAQARAALGWDTDPPAAERPAKSDRSAGGTKAGKAGKAAQTDAPRTAQLPQQRRTDAPSAADFPEWAAVAGSSPAAAASPEPGPERRTRRGRTIMYAVGAAGAALVTGAAVLLLNPGAAPPKKTAARAAAAPSPRQVMPAGVRCTGAGCVGKDPEEMGCGGTHAITPSRGRAGRAVIEVRYSKICHTAWARISRAAPGDQATLSAGGHSATARAERNGAAYTAMVEVTGDPAKVSACGTTMTGVKGCSRPVPATPAGAPDPSAGSPSPSVGAPGPSVGAAVR
ncbi:helix-turn-helix domain-containing protein [Streptomyces sp. NPDC058773]|uniref:helix-turn-helix domain-containing protein n=1 Tax=Streptomyces sp. NPDC058773 TaxID=3346632 RepID=UPI0036754723